MISSLLLITLLPAGGLCTDQLLGVITVFRHGDRAPSAPYPKDPYGPENWPNGWSELTKRGEDEAYELGNYLRKRYGVPNGPIPETHDPAQVFVRSTSKKRAIETARNVARGLYPIPNNRSVEIRIVTPHTQDLLLKPNSFACPAYDRVSKRENAKLYRHYNKVYASFFRFLSLNTGYHVTMENIDKVFDAVFRETVHGLKQPQWLKKKISVGGKTSRTAYDLIIHLKQIQRLSEFDSTQESKLRTGYLLGEITKRMQSKARNDANQEPVTLYSSHDATLTALLYNLGVSNNLLTPYAAAIIFELYRDPTINEHFVKVLYRNETNAAPHEMTVPGCAYSRCSLKTFSSALASRIFWTKEEAVKSCAAK